MKFLGGHALIKGVEIKKGKVSAQDPQDEVLNTKKTYFSPERQRAGRDKDRR